MRPGRAGEGEAPLTEQLSLGPCPVRTARKTRASGIPQRARGVRAALAAAGPSQCLLSSPQELSMT